MFLSLVLSIFGTLPILEVYTNKALFYLVHSAPPTTCLPVTQPGSHWMPLALRPWTLVTDEVQQR